MVRNDDGPPTEARPPLLADLIALCRSLNREGARYIVIGGMAIIQAGFVRATEAIDLLLDGSHHFRRAQIHFLARRGAAGNKVRAHDAGQKTGAAARHQGKCSLSAVSIASEAFTHRL